MILYIIYSILRFLVFILVLKELKHFAMGIYESFIAKGYNYVETYGENSWVAVTGATDGIGFEFCREITWRKLNVILLSRTESKLKNSCEELRKEFPDVKFEYNIADFWI